MSGQHPKTAAWDKALEEAVDRVNRTLEVLHGESYPLSPNRPGVGKTCNPQMDGLFNFGVKFTMGYGSSLGKGYVLDLVIATRAAVPENVRIAWEEEAAVLLARELQESFPGRDLQVRKDGRDWKIVGDFRLGQV